MMDNQEGGLSRIVLPSKRVLRCETIAPGLPVERYLDAAPVESLTWRSPLQLATYRDHRSGARMTFHYAQGRLPRAVTVQTPQGATSYLLGYDQAGSLKAAAAGAWTFSESSLSFSPCAFRSTVLNVETTEGPSVAPSKNPIPMALDMIYPDATEIATGKNPLAIAVFLAIGLGETAVRWLLGQDLDAVWFHPVWHAGLASAVVHLFFRATDRLS